MKEKIQKSEALLTKFFNWAKHEVPTYRIRDINTDLLVQHFIKRIDSLTNSEESIQNDPKKDGYYCAVCGHREFWKDEDEDDKP